MSVPTTSLTAVNAAFLQEIKDDHRELRETMARLADHLRIEAAPAPWRKVVEDVRRLRDRLAMHFALEEGYGYCDDAIEVAPRLSERAHALRAEHSVLYLRIDEIVEQAERVLFHETTMDRCSAISRNLSEFLLDFERHERLECELILEAYAQDLGSGD